MGDFGRERAYRATRRGAHAIDAYAVFCFALLFAVSIMAALESRMLHWFLVPTTACALVCGRDALAWVSGRLDPFDPRGVVGMVGLHLFFIAPMLLVWWDMEYDVATRPEDWRPWLGILSTFLLLGLGCYRVAENLAYRKLRVRPSRWVIDEDRVFMVLVPALVLSGAAQAYLWLRYGGILGQFATYKSGDPSSLSGRFKYQLVAGAFPILLLILITLLRSRRARGGPQRGRYSVAFFLLGLTFILYFVTDGLRGSRSAIIWTLFWATGIIHYFWRRLSARVILAGLIPVFLFMYAYGLYKSYGREVMDVYEESRSITEMSERSGRTVRRLLVRDLSRSDIQAFMTYRLLSENDDAFALQWGATYAETVPRLLVPSWLWSGRPAVPKKARAAAALHYGGFVPFSERLSKVYGLAGEAMLNFHIYGVPLAFTVYGLIMGLYRRYRASFPALDARLYVAPFFANWFLAALIGDFDNLMVFTMTKGVFPLLVLVLLVKRRPI